MRAILFVVVSALTLLSCKRGAEPHPPAPDAPLSVRETSEAFQLDSPPLDRAIAADDVAQVRDLLDKGEDVNLRWSSHGDRFPLQTAIDALTLHFSTVVHRQQIIELLLRRGADANARWCPFESRVGAFGAYDWDVCTSPFGVTAILRATEFGDFATVALLLRHGVDTRLEDQFGATPLDVAWSEPVFNILRAEIRAREKWNDRDVLNYLNGRDTKTRRHGPWDETALTRAIAGDLGGLHWIPSGSHSTRVGRVRALLAIGANPNRRLTRGGVDWTPLAIAVAAHDVDVVSALLTHGADPLARWCVPIGLDPSGRPTPRGGCDAANESTVLTLAPSLGFSDISAEFARRGIR